MLAGLVVAIVLIPIHVVAAALTRKLQVRAETFLETQAGKTFFDKYCFPNLHWIHGKAIEVEACEFVPVQHPRKWLSTTIDSAYMSWKAPPVNLQSWIRIQSPSATCLKG